MPRSTFALDGACRLRATAPWPPASLTDLSSVHCAFMCACRTQLAADLREEFTRVIAEAEDQATSSELQSVLPLLSLTTTQLSFSTLTRVLFRIAFRYK